MQYVGFLFCRSKLSYNTYNIDGDTYYELWRVFFEKVVGIMHRYSNAVKLLPALRVMHRLLHRMIGGICGACIREVSLKKIAKSDRQE